ncbi:Uncharacterised protein [Vibrio cholerae]|nr:Uncharacterised protein [Vibrio cholerae]
MIKAETPSFTYSRNGLSILLIKASNRFFETG